MVAASAMLVVLVVAAWLLCPRDHTPQGDDEAWGQAGNIVVYYGPVHEPFSSSVENAYYLYSPKGELLGKRKGPGAYAPVALPLQGGTALSFKGRIAATGTHELDQSITSDYLDYWTVAPSGSHGAFFYNDSPGDHFQYSWYQFGTSGRLDRGSFTGAPEVAASSTRGTLALIRDAEPSEIGGTNTSTVKLLYIDRSGKQSVIDTPAGFGANTPYVPVVRLLALDGDRFSLIEPHAVGDQEYRNRVFTFSVNPRPTGEVSIDVESVHTVTQPRLKDVLLARPLYGGRVGSLQKDGRVHLYSVISGTDSITGDLSSEIDQGATPLRVPSWSGDYFALRLGNAISIRSWEKPDNALWTVPVDEHGCGNNGLQLALGTGCDIGGVAVAA